MMMANDLQGVSPLSQDDGYPVYDGVIGLVGDEDMNDRTHKASIDGYVKVSYENNSMEKTIDICNRDPDERRVLEIRCFILKEPFQDIGYVLDWTNPNSKPIGVGNGKFDFENLNGNKDENGFDIFDFGEPSEPFLDYSCGENEDFRRGEDPYFNPDSDGWGAVVNPDYVLDQIKRANIAWAQACIKIIEIEPVEIIDIPEETLRNNWLSYQHLGRFDFLNDAELIFNAFNNDLIIDNQILYIFFNTDMIDENVRGIAYDSKNTDFPHDGHSLTFISAHSKLGYRTLAHEIGHILSYLRDPDYGTDSVTDSHIFFPRMPIFWMDILPEMTRRLTSKTVEECHKNEELLKPYY